MDSPSPGTNMKREGAPGLCKRLTDEFFGGDVEGQFEHLGLGVDLNTDAAGFDRPFGVFDEDGGGGVAVVAQGLRYGVANFVGVPGRGSGGGVDGGSGWRNDLGAGLSGHFKGGISFAGLRFRFGEG